MRPYRSFYILSLGLLPLLLLAAGPVSAETVYVAKPPFGNDTTGNGTPVAPWETIQHAYNMAATQGVTIVVAPGTFDECVDATSLQVEVSAGVFEQKWATIRANHPNNAFTTINGDSLCTTVTVGGLGGGVEGFTITGGGDSGVEGSHASARAIMTR